MKTYILFILVMIGVVACQKQEDNSPIDYLKLSDVRLLDSEFKNAQEQDIAYLMALDPDRLLAPFLREAGLEPKAESYPNWENTGLDGHIGGHYLTALSLMYASTDDQEIKQRLDYMLVELKRCQDANGNGYIGGVPGGNAMWQEIKEGNIRPGAFSLNEKWVPLYNIHKTYAGLRDAWLYAGNEEAKQMLIAMTDWMLDLVADLSDDQIQSMLISEHGGLNETFADVAEITGDEKYLTLAKQFSHREILDPLIEHHDELNGKHANTQIPKVIGYQRVAELGGDSAWSDAALFFWNDVVNERSVCIGGNSVREHFHPKGDFSEMISSVEGPETCNSYNMLKLTRMLYRTYGNDSKFIDYFEKTLYNHILASINPNNGGLVYFTPMRPNHYRVYSQPQTSFWCCVGSGIENPGKYNEMIYAHSDNSLYVNLFIPSVLNWKAKNTEVILETQFPDDSKVKLTVNPEAETNFNLKIRYPEWVADGEMEMKVNGKSVRFYKTSNGYAALERQWKEGDEVEIVLPMKPGLDQLPDGSNNFALTYGPIVLAAETGTDDLRGLYADASRMGHVAHGHMVPLKDRQVIIANENELTTKLKRTSDDTLEFELDGVFTDGHKTKLNLKPFYRIHDSRYNIYWAQATEEELQAKIEEMEKAEQAELALNKITVDKIGCGEQQPEADHFIEFRRSWTGYHNDRHFREANAWFSYKLNNKNEEGRYIYLEYFDREVDRKTDIFIDDQLLSTFELDGEGGEEPLVKILPLPESEWGKETIELKFAAMDRRKTMQLIEVRLLDSEKGI
ncbi:glycoside hydrolase family 127 protein [Maribellus mangrovi]|uniref:glycoside hydrolase family 127 protein n=1 Tax=Maribellus mangrovi TaxID=3133146 RepID=UPI0030EDE68A